MSEDSKRHIAYRNLDAYREHIFENLDGARLQAELGLTYAETRDDAGLDYSIRKLVAYTRAAVSTLVDLQEAKADQVSRKERVPA